MSELSVKIRALRGDLSQGKMAEKVGVSLRTITNLELGKASVKLDTLRQLATALGLPTTEWLDLLVAWLKQEVGTDAVNLWLEPRIASSSPLRDKAGEQTARALMLFQNLNASERDEITKAMERPEVRACLPAINRVWEKFDASKKKT